MSKYNNENYDYLMHSASANDQTGLIPSGITSDAEKESYQSLYPYYPQPVLKLNNSRTTNHTSDDSGSGTVPTPDDGEATSLS